MYQRKEKLKIIVVEVNDELILAAHLYIEKNTEKKIGHIHDVLLDKSRYQQDLVEECLKRSIGALEKIAWMSKCIDIKIPPKIVDDNIMKDLLYTQNSDEKGVFWSKNSNPKVFFDIEIDRKIVG